MNIRTLFINNFGRLRSGWRLIFYFLAFFLFYFLLVGATRILYAIFNATGLRLPFASFVEEIVFRTVFLISALAGGYLSARVLEELPWRSLGLTLHRAWFRDFLFGTLVGTLSLSLAVAIAMLCGGLRLTLSGTDIAFSVVKSVGGSGVLFVVAALAEEAAFRGYPLQTLSRAKLIWLGVLLTSVPFGLVHLNNPNVVPGVTFANTALAGVWLAIAYLKTRSLWLPLGVHWSWNWALGSLFGLPVSGINLVSHPLFKGTDLGPAWLTGGNYGIEGGVACTIALIVSSLFLWRTNLVSATPELQQLTSQENPASAARLSITPPVHPAENFSDSSQRAAES